MYLNCHTYFSFKYGTLSVERLFNEARRCGVHKLVLTEINNTASYIEMLRMCQEHAANANGLNKFGGEAFDLTIIPGIEFRNGHEFRFIGIPRNNTGFEELTRYLSFLNESGKTVPARAPQFSNVFVIYRFQAVSPEELTEHEFIGVTKNELTKFKMSPAADFKKRFVALHPVTFENKIDFNIHRLLRAIDNNTLLSKLPVSQQAQPDEVMLPEREFGEIFSSHPELIANSRSLLDQCAFEYELGGDKNKKHVKGNEESDWQYLVENAWKGFTPRYGERNAMLVERMERELRIIRSKGFCSYYLIAYDLIQFASSQGFDYVGRGSGANSMVAYCLGITNVDPIELNLYFERFLNEERTSPPDFDIDFAWDNRDAIYNYIFTKYGKEHVCLLGTHVTFQGRAVLRELAKVFGLPKSEIDDLVDHPKELEHRDQITELIFRYAGYMKDFPSNLSIHAGGVLITEKPVYAYTATAFPPKGYPISHFEMHAAEDIGIYKFDILSQRGLGHLKEAVSRVKKNQGVDVDITRFREFKIDPKIRELLRRSKTMGCFYVESPAMRMLLGKLRCEDYLTLVAASSIIRPGVASSGMMKAYIERFHLTRNGGTYESIHPKMDELMSETFGVMVYQEDVIKVAHHFAGLSLTQADVLRRGMSGKYRSRQEFQLVKDEFFSNCQRLGHPQKVIDRVWFEIESFSGYSFAKGHSASYAVESYQSLYLKAHYPLEFMVGVINNFGGFYKTEFYVHEARMNGGEIVAPCVNNSDRLTGIDGTRIYLGFIHIKSLESRIAHQIQEERKRSGKFRTLADFLTRVPMGLEQARILIRIDALRFTGKDKQRLLWETMLFYSQAKTRNPAAQLFGAEPTEFPLPALQRNSLEDAFDEIELLGFPLCDPFNLLETEDRGDANAVDLIDRVGRIVHIVGYMVTVKETWTRSREYMNFGTFLDKNGDVFDTVHFPNIAKQYPLRILLHQRKGGGRFRHHNDRSDMAR
jgi:DNA polymerase-3 subunit alpha